MALRELTARVTLAAGTLLAACGGGAGGLDPTAAGRVMIIGLDGARADAVLAAATPHLDALAASGAADFTAITGDVALSGPGWASMLTGVWCDKHGVLDNDITWQGSRFDEFPHFLRRLEAAQPQRVTASVSHWAPINDEILCADEAGECPVDHVASPDTDAGVRDEAVRLLRETDVAALFLQFDDIDHAGHGDPPYLPPAQGGFCPFAEGDAEYRGQVGACAAADFNPEYLEVIERTDGYVGEVLAALRARPRYAAENWLVIVSPDHGGGGVIRNQHGFPHHQDRRTFLIVSGAGVAALPQAQLKIVDVAATALAHLGLPPQAEWGLAGQPIGIAAAAYRDDPVPACADRLNVFGDERLF